MMKFANNIIENGSTLLAKSAELASIVEKKKKLEKILLAKAARDQVQDEQSADAETR
jgi:hypothetical protein